MTKELNPGVDAALREIFGEPPGEVSAPSSINDEQLGEKITLVGDVTGNLPQHDLKTALVPIIVRKDGTCLEFDPKPELLTAKTTVGIAQFLAMVSMAPHVAGYITVNWSQFIADHGIEAHFTPGYEDTRMYVNAGYGHGLIIFLEDPGAQLNLTIPTGTID